MFLILDALAAGEGKRLSSLDVIGAGPRAIAGLLEMFNVPYKIMRIEDYLRSKWRGFDVLLVSAMSMDEPAVNKAVRMFKGPKILGGPITSELSVVGKLNFDLGVWGEGELALEMLLKKGLSSGFIPDSLEGIPNLIFPGGKLTKISYLKSQDMRRFRPSTEAIRFYNTIPHYKSARVYVEVVRSCSNFNRPKIGASLDICKVCQACYKQDLRKRLICPQNIPPGCGYCSIPYLYGTPKSRDVDDILSEIRALVRLGVRRVVLSGADFLEYGREYLVDGPLTHPSIPGPNIKALKSLLEGVKSISDEHNVFFEAENVKPCLVDEEVARLLGKYLRGSPIHIGVETGDPSHAEVIGRPCRPEDSLKAIKLLKEAGLRPYAYFIHSLPGQTRSTAKNTIKVMYEAFRLGSEKITVYKFRPLPGTAFSGYRVKVDNYSREIARTAIDLNKMRKRELLGRRIAVIIAPSYRRGSIYAYPVKGGPVVRIKARKRFRVGDILTVRIIKVLSDRLVEGLPEN